VDLMCLGETNKITCGKGTLEGIERRPTRVVTVSPYVIRNEKCELKHKMGTIQEMEILMFASSRRE
jgi:hypothetical protein